jgi:hypothetical protein
VITASLGVSHGKHGQNYSHGRHRKHGKNIATENTESTEKIIPVAAEWEVLGVLLSGQFAVNTGPVLQ